MEITLFHGRYRSCRQQAFLKETGVDEIIAVCAMYDIGDRIKSVRLFGEVNEEINEGG